MNDYFCEHTVQEKLRELVALDRQLTRWGWFRRYEHGSRKSGWRFCIGEALIRMGCRLQERGCVQPAGTAGKP